MKLSRRKNKLIFIPLFSMSDIAFLLLIFIMVIALTNYRKEVKIEYAEAQYVLNTGAEKNIEVWIDRDGQLYIEGELSNIPDLERTVIDLYIGSPDTRIHIIADRFTAYEKINAVLEVLQILQYRTVSFVARHVE